KAKSHENANCLRNSLPAGAMNPTRRGIHRQKTPIPKRASRSRLTLRLSKISGRGTVNKSCLIAPIAFAWSPLFPVAPERVAEARVDSPFFLRSRAPPFDLQEHLPGARTGSSAERECTR